MGEDGRHGRPVMGPAAARPVCGARSQPGRLGIAAGRRSWRGEAPARSTAYRYIKIIQGAVALSGAQRARPGRRPEGQSVRSVVPKERHLSGRLPGLLLEARAVLMPAVLARSPAALTIAPRSPGGALDALELVPGAEAAAAPGLGRAE